MLRDRVGAAWQSGRILLIALLLLVLLDRLLLLTNFSFVFTGSDDTLYWQAAVDYARGIFREPFFYGQNYGYMLESLCAVPLLWLGIPPYVALPLVTSVLALLPFVLLAFAFHRQGSVVGGALCLLVPLSLPIEYGILTGMSRGFVGGLPFAAALALCWFHPQRRQSFVLFGVLAPIAYLVNPNSVPLILMTGVYLLLTAPFRPLWYVLAALPTIPLWGLNELAKGFYKVHPDHLVHWMEAPTFSWEAMVHALSQLDLYFKHLGPIFWSAGWIWLFVFLAIAVLTWRHDRKWSVVLVGITIALVLFLGISKVRDGVDNIFLSRERMFLAFPVMIALVLGWSARIFRWDGTSWFAPLLAIALCMVGVKSGYYPLVVASATAREDQGPVAIVPMDELKRDCTFLADKAQQYAAEVVVLVPDDQKTSSMQAARTYGCPILRPGMADTFLIVGENRTWMYMKQMEQIPATVLIYGTVPALSTSARKHTLIHLEPDLLLVQNNNMPLASLLSDLGVTMKRHPYM